MKTLIFEPAGCVNAGRDNLNCRIRTAFRNKEGKAFYLEIRSGVPNEYQRKMYPSFRDPYMQIDYFFEINIEDPDFDDCNCGNIKLRNFCCCKHSFSKKEIVRFVNAHCDTDFDDISAPEMSGYRVFTDNRKVNKGYRFANEFVYDPVFSEKCIKKVAELKNHFRDLFHQRYDNTSYWVTDEKKLMVCINVEEKKRLAAGYTERRFEVAV